MTLDRAALRRAHQPDLSFGITEHGHCKSCNQWSPCPVILLLDALEQAEGSHTLTDAVVTVESDGRVTVDHAVYHRLQAKLAASEKRVVALEQEFLPGLRADPAQEAT